MYGTTAARTPDQTTIRYTHPIARHTPHAPSIRSCSQFSVFPDDGNSHLIIHTAASLIQALQGSSMRSWHWAAIFNGMFMDCETLFRNVSLDLPRRTFTTMQSYLRFLLVLEGIFQLSICLCIEMRVGERQIARG